MLVAADNNLPVKQVKASRGKSARAEPVSALYAAGRVPHQRTTLYGTAPDAMRDRSFAAASGAQPAPAQAAPCH